VNLLLLDSPDFIAPERARIAGRRLAHLRQVIQARPGDSLRAGLLEGALGTATLLHCDDRIAELAVVLDTPPPEPLPVTLLLALPRPKVLRRCLRAATLLGVKDIHLLHSWRVDKSYWQTPLLAPQRLREELLLALEQARDTRLPRIALHRRFKPFVEDELEAVAGARSRLLAHPGASTPLAGAAGEPLALAIGPEGGFIPYEVECLTARGFVPVSLGARVLTVEVALAAALGRLGPR
jgi:RsmE family RNA methyltransferase